MTKRIRPIPCKFCNGVAKYIGTLTYSFLTNRESNYRSSHKDIYKCTKCNRKQVKK